MRLTPTVRRVQYVSAFIGYIYMTIRTYVTFRLLGTSDLRMKTMFLRQWVDGHLHLGIGILINWQMRSSICTCLVN